MASITSTNIIRQWSLNTGFHSMVLHSCPPPYVQRAVSFVCDNSSVCSDDSVDTMSTDSTGSTCSTVSTVVDGTAVCGVEKPSCDIIRRYMPSHLFTRVCNVYGRNPIGSSIENIVTVLDDCGWSDYEVLRVLDYLIDENDHCGFEEQATRAEIYVKRIKDVLEGVISKKEL